MLLSEVVLTKQTRSASKHVPHNRAVSEFDSRLKKRSMQHVVDYSDTRNFVRDVKPSSQKWKDKWMIVVGYLMRPE